MNDRAVSKLHSDAKWKSRQMSMKPIHWEPGEREALIAKEIEAGRVTKCEPVKGEFYTQVFGARALIEFRQTSLRHFGGRLKGAL